jgi:hypothetical protein
VKQKKLNGHVLGSSTAGLIFIHLLLLVRRIPSWNAIMESRASIFLLDCCCFFTSHSVVFYFSLVVVNYDYVSPDRSWRTHLPLPAHSCPQECLSSTLTGADSEHCHHTYRSFPSYLQLN